MDEGQPYIKSGETSFILEEEAKYLVPPSSMRRMLVFLFVFCFFIGGGGHSLNLIKMVALKRCHFLNFKVE